MKWDHLRGMKTVYISDPVTPNSAMRKAVRFVLTPVQSKESEEILKK